MTVDANDPTGIRNLVASIERHLKAQLSGVDVFIGNYNQAQKFPCVTVQNDGLFSLGDTAYGDLLESGVKGRIEQTQLEINVMDKLNSTNRDHWREVHIMVDKVRQAFEDAGLKTGIPAIAIYDYSQTPPTDTGRIAWMPTDLDTCWIPKNIVNEALPSLFRVRVYVRIYWEKLSTY